MTSRGDILRNPVGGKFYKTKKKPVFQKQINHKEKEKKWIGKPKDQKRQEIYQTAATYGSDLKPDPNKWI